MAGEFIIKNGSIISGSLQVTGGITGSFGGSVPSADTASYINPLTQSVFIQGATSIYKSGSTALDIQGSQGQLFSVVDQLSGSLMSVNDVSGLPILEVFSDDRVEMGTYGAPGLVVSGSSIIATGSLSGTASYSETSVLADTASYVNPLTQSVNISGSFILSSGKAGFYGEREISTNLILGSAAAVEPAGQSVVIGQGANVGTIRSNSTVIGYNAASKESTAVVGHDAYAESYGIAVGASADAQDYGVAIGYATNASGQHSTAVGRQALSSGNYSTALGRQANSSGTNSVALGYLSSATQTDAVAIGNGAQSTATRAIALGAGITANTADTLFTRNANFSGSVTIESSGSTVLSVEGSTGNLFSIDDSLSGSLMSVGNISGLPMLEVFDDGTIIGGPYNFDTLVVTGSRIGIGTDDPGYTLDVQGNAFISSSLVVDSGLSTSGSVVVNNGAVGIVSTGTTNATEALRVQNATPEVLFEAKDDGELNINTTKYSNNGVLTNNGGIVEEVAGYTGIININTTPPIAIDVQNGIIVNVT